MSARLIARAHCTRSAVLAVRAGRAAVILASGAAVVAIAVGSKAAGVEACGCAGRRGGRPEVRRGRRGRRSDAVAIVGAVLKGARTDAQAAVGR